MLQRYEYVTYLHLKDFCNVSITAINGDTVLNVALLSIDTSLGDANTIANIFQSLSV